MMLTVVIATVTMIPGPVLVVGVGHFTEVSPVYVQNVCVYVESGNRSIHCTVNSFPFLPMHSCSSIHGTYCFNFHKLRAISENLCP